MGNVYNREFQEMLIDHADKSADRIIPFIYDLFAPNSVVDFGCGTGNFLATVKKYSNNKCEVLGLDGNYIEKDLLQINYEKEFMSVDLTAPIMLKHRYEMAFSLEVGEHLDEKYADVFVDSITRASDIVLFSAALPGQYGVHHVNERYISYWIEKFSDRQYQCFDIMRPHFWWDHDIDLDYRQNMMIFVKQNADGVNETLVGKLRSMETHIYDIAHPEFLEARTKAWRYWMDKVEQFETRHTLMAKLLKKVWTRYK